MKKYLTRRDIMEMLCITSARFEWCVKVLNIYSIIELNQRLFNIQDLIDIYYFVSRKEVKTIVFEEFQSKINCKKLKL